MAVTSLVLLRNARSATPETVARAAETPAGTDSVATTGSG